jgi:hypothetical protein
MRFWHGGNDITGRTAEEHAEKGGEGGGSMRFQRGGNDVTGRTAEEQIISVQTPFIIGSTCLKLRRRSSVC